MNHPSRSMNGLGILSVAAVATALLIGRLAKAEDWPTWRHDASRSAASGEELPSDLHLRWSCQYPAPRPAWPDARLRFDATFQPVVAGKTLVFGSSRSDCVVALDTDSGTEKWRFFTDGPVRPAPAICRGKVYVAADDGFLYCLSMETGELLWKFQGAPTVQKVLGNERLISMWPARGGPVVREDTVYFAAGVWPFMGIFPASAAIS